MDNLVWRQTAQKSRIAGANRLDVAFIHGGNGNSISCQFCYKFIDLFLHLAGAAIGVHREADNQAGRAPFKKKSGDCVVVNAAIAISDNSERAGRSGHVLTNGNANTSQPVVERQYGAWRWHSGVTGFR